MREVAAYRNLPGQQYPIGLVPRASHRLRHRRRSSRRQWGRRPGELLEFDWYIESDLGVGCIMLSEVRVLVPLGGVDKGDAVACRGCSMHLGGSYLRECALREDTEGIVSSDGKDPGWKARTSTSKSFRRHHRQQ